MRYHRFDFPDLPLEAFKHYGDRRIKPQGGGGGIIETITSPITSVVENVTGNFGGGSGGGGGGGGGGGWFGDFLGNPLGTVVNTASDIVNGASDTLHAVTAPILDPISDAIHDVSTTVAKSPILNTAAYAIMVANGVPPMVASGVLSANAGASPENIVKNMALAGIGSEIASQVAPEISKLSESQLFGQAAGQAAGSAASAAVAGKDPLAAALTSFVSSGANVAAGDIVKDIPGFENLPKTAQDSVRSAVSASLQGKDPTMAAVNRAMNAGVQEAVKYGTNIFNGSVTNMDQADFGTNQGAVDKVAEMEAREREAEDAARAAEERRFAEEENIRLIEEERLRQEATQPPPQAPITVPGEGGTTATIDPNTGEVTFSEPPPAIETPVTEPPAKEPDVTQTLTDAGLKEETWTPPTGLPPADTPTGLDNEGGVNESGVLMPDGSFKTWAELDELAGVPPGTIYTDGGTTITEKELQDILNGTYTNPKQVPKPGAGTPKPPAPTPTPKPTTPTTPAPATQQNNSANMLALLSLLQPQQQQQAPPPVQGADVKLMEDIFGTNFITPRPEGTKKYSSGGEIEALLHLLRS